MLLAMQPKRKGRPRKDKGLNFNALGPEKNMNGSNTFPASKLSTLRAAVAMKSDNVLYHVEYDEPKFLRLLFDAIKKKRGYIFMIFSASGIVIHEQVQEVADKVSFICKLFPDRMTKFESVDMKDHHIRIEFDKIANIFKGLNNDSPIILDLVDFGEQGKKLRIYQKNSVNGSVTNVCLEVCKFVGYKAFGEGMEDVVYDFVYIMESKILQETVKGFKSTSDGKIAFDCVATEETAEEPVFIASIGCESNDRSSTVKTFTASDKFVFLQSNEIPVKCSFSLSNFNKFLSASKFSTIVKVYLSLTEPMILEYNIDGGYGVLQIFIEEIKQLK